ncbi:hypothetical protein ACHAXA_009130 [Cyclostephanos tholiformis]|uniref:CRAL-TRIO domain-containing protein n=1 Tax=Cyclostephanos tholiformis TaxID=382380 RepID=A0ABD3RWS5_9STRA
MTVLLRSRSLVRGIFHYHVANDNVKEEGGKSNPTSANVDRAPPPRVIAHSSTAVTLTDWDDDDYDDDDVKDGDDDGRVAGGDRPTPPPPPPPPPRPPRRRPRLSRRDDDPPPPPSIVDDVTDLERLGRIEHSRKCGRAYDEEYGVSRIRMALTSDELTSLSDDDMPLRHYRAEKGDIDGAIRKIRNTIRWREEFGVEYIKRCFDDLDEYDEYSTTSAEERTRMMDLANAISFENRTGKVYCRGYDRMGRAVLYLTPGRENSNDELNNMRHLVYQLERAIACTRRTSGRGKICIVIGYQGFRLTNAPPPSTVRHTLAILQHHYPERMHRAYICDPPLVFRTFWGAIRRFVDPTTLEKIAFCVGTDGRTMLERDFDTATTEVQAGGTGLLRQFDSSEYLFDTPFDRTFDERGS